MAKKKKISRELYDNLVSNQKVQTNNKNIKTISRDAYSSLVSTTDRLNRGGTKQNIAPLPSTTISKKEVSNNTQKSFSFDINNKYDDGYKNTGKKIGDYIKDSSLKDSEIFQKDNKFYYYDSNKKQYNEITNKTGYDAKENKNTKKTKQIAPVSEHFTNSKQSNINTTGKFEEPVKTVKAREDKLGLEDRLKVEFSGKSDKDKKKMEEQIIEQNKKDNNFFTGKNGALPTVKKILDLGGLFATNFAEGALGQLEGGADWILERGSDLFEAMGNEDIANLLSKSASDNLVSDFFEPSQKILRESTNTKEDDWFEQISQGLGQAGTTILTGGLAKTPTMATALSTGSMFLGSAGQGEQQALQEGASSSEAFQYGLLKGAGDSLTEMMFGGLGKGSKALGISRSALPIDDVIAQKVSSKFQNALLKNLTELGIKSTAEGFEEVVAGVTDAVSKKITYAKDEDLNKLLNDEKLLDQFISGAVVSGIMQTPGLVKSTKQGRSLTTNYTDNEQKVVDNVTENRFNEQLKDNPNMSKKEQNQLRADIEEQTKTDLDNGNLTPTEIQNALGNDDYQTYQNESKRKQDLEKQLKELQSKSANDMSYSEYNENNQKIADLQNQIDSINLDDLKSKADTPVENRIQNNDYLLQRSYNNYQNNQAQKNVVFEYQPQTDSKGKEVQVSDLEKNVYDSAARTNMNNTKESHNLADFVSKLSKDTGIQYEFTTTEDLKNRGYNVGDNVVINGLNTDDGKILINIDSDSIINRVVGHETTHLLENTEDYKILQNEVFEYAKTKGDFDKLKTELTETYKNVKGANIDNELTSELVGQYVFSDTEFVQSLSKHRNIFQKVYDEIKHLYKMATAGSKEARQLERVKRTFEKVYQNNEAKVGNTKYSLNKKLKNYTNKELENFKGGKIEIAKTTNDIDAFVNEELLKKTSNNKILFGKVSDEIATTISKKFGINIDDYSISLKGDNVRKIMKDHGNPETESKRGQIAVTKSDFDYIDDIILEPDNIYLSGKTLSGKPSITFEKNIDNKYTLVEFVSDKNHTLEVQTMYKHKKKNSSTADNTLKSLLLTSETDSGSSSSTYNVSQPNNNVKSNTSNKQYAPASKNNTQYSLNNDNLVPLQEGEVQSQDVRNENRPIAPLPTNTQNANVSNNTEVVIPTNNTQESIQEATSTNKTLNPAEIAQIRPENASTTPKIDNIKVSTGDGKSHFFDNIKDKVNMLSEDSKAKILSSDEVKYYKEVTNEDSLNKAFKKLSDGGEFEVKSWIDRFSRDKDGKMKQQPTAVDIAEGWILLKQYNDIKDYDSSVQIAKKMRDIGTEAGQTIQAFNIMNRMTPEGMVKYAQSELSEAYEHMVKGKTKKWIDQHRSDFDLKPEEVQFIIDNMQEVSTMKDGYDKKVKLAEIQKLMTDKIPPAKGQGIKAWMRISMLFNPKTQVRNVLGNALIAPVNSFGDLFASGMDRLVARQTGVRTVGTTSLKSYSKGMKKGLFESYNDFKKGINTRDISGNRFEIGEGKSFNEKTMIGKSLNRVDSLLSFMLDAGDRMFYEGSFVNSINNQMVLNNTDIVTQDMIDIATQEALSRTWQDNNEYTKFVLSVRRLLNKIPTPGHSGYGIGDILIPFAKTPANLTKALVDYSPAGLVSTLIKGNNLRNAINTGQYTAKIQHNFVQSLGKATAGTALYILGYALAKAGILSGESDDDKDVSNFMKNTMGVNSYSIKIGDKSFTYDWAQPLAGPFSMMANLVNKQDQEASLFEKITSTLDTAGNVIFEQSFLESINTVLNNNDGFATGIEEAILDLPARAVPTVMKQITDMVDGTQRVSFEYDKPLESAINSIKAKIPGLSQTLAPSVDSMGREIQKYGGKNNIFNVFFNPANVNNENVSESAKEIYRVYKQTGDSTILPRVAPYYVNSDGEKIVLDSKQREKLQKKSGTLLEQGLDNMMKNDTYINASDEDKAEMINGLVNYSYNIAQHEVVGTELSQTYEKAYNFASNGGNIENYYIYKYSIKDMDSNEKEKYLYNSDFSNDQKTLLYENITLSDFTDESKYLNYKTAKQLGIDINSWLNYSSQEFKSDLAPTGKTISGSRKKKLITFVNSLNLTIPQKASLIKMSYGSYDSYDKQIMNEVNSLNISFMDKAKMVKTLGFDEYDKSIINYVDKNYSNMSEKTNILKDLGFTVYTYKGRTYVR